MKIKARRVLHKPVLLKEVLDRIANCLETNNTSDSVVVDATLGDGGHSVAILDQIKPKNLVSLEWDEVSIRFVIDKFRSYSPELLYYDYGKHEFDKNPIPLEEGKWVVVHANFSYIPEILEKLGLEKVDVFLWDLGISSRQLLAKKRGFSFKDSGPLDMRMDKTHNDVPAYVLLNLLSKSELTKLFSENVGMPLGMASRLAREIIDVRKRKPFGDSDDVARLNVLAQKLYPLRKGSKGRLHPSTLIFLALRMAVNYELQNLKTSLAGAVKTLKQKGCLLVIVFHSGEEKVVQDFIEEYSLNYEIIKPTREEIGRNPRARSAKMYVIQNG